MQGRRGKRFKRDRADKRLINEKEVVMKQNELYKKCILHHKESPDGETGTYIIVTKEINCCLIWLDGYEDNEIIANFPLHKKDEAIEVAVGIGKLSYPEIKDADQRAVENHCWKKKNNNQIKNPQ
jgi:hypothetical protein